MGPKFCLFGDVSGQVDQEESEEDMPVCISGVGEVEVAGQGMLNNVVDAGEIRAEVVVQQNAGGICGRIDECQLGRREIGLAFVTEDNLLAFAAVGWSAGWVERGAAIGILDVLVSGRGDGVVVVEIDRCDVDWVVEVAGPVAGCIELACSNVIYAGFVEGFI